MTHTLNYTIVNIAIQYYTTVLYFAILQYLTKLFCIIQSFPELYYCIKQGYTVSKYAHSQALSLVRASRAIRPNEGFLAQLADLQLKLRIKP